MMADSPAKTVWMEQGASWAKVRAVVEAKASRRTRDDMKDGWRLRAAKMVARLVAVCYVL